MRQLFRKYPLSRVLPALTVAAMAFALVAADSASAAYTDKTLHSFCARAYCADGGAPQDRLVMDQNGILYGTASDGGKYGGGVVFKLVPNSDKSRYTEYVLHNFCRHDWCPDGSTPIAGVILDIDGNVYGTARGNSDIPAYGTIFKLTHGSNGWTFKVLKSFCEESNCTDGVYPSAGLSYAGQDSGKAWDESSPLFGTTDEGGAHHNGVVYELTSSGNYSVIHNTQTGMNPNEVLVDSAGNIYGTATYGGKYGGGVMYRLASGTWSETTLHNFCNSTNCSDGQYPLGRLVMDSSGNLFGTTNQGGSNSNSLCVNGGTCGVVFERASGGTYSVRYNFCSQGNCTDGASPSAGVIIDASGNLFGTASRGGETENVGIVYELSGGTESVLYSFCSQQNCVDGGSPRGAVILDSSGGLFGTAYYGGAHSSGTVYRLGP